MTLFLRGDELEMFSDPILRATAKWRGASLRGFSRLNLTRFQEAAAAGTAGVSQSCSSNTRLTRFER